MLSIFKSYALATLCCFIYLCLQLLLTDLPNSNEISKFTDAMPRIDPTWLPAMDTKTNLFVDRQQLFHTLISPLLKWEEFFWTALVGRLTCFFLLSLSFISLTRALRLRTSLSIIVLALFIPYQSLAAGEWIMRGVEPKVVSYALTLMALSLILNKRHFFLISFFLLGLSTSFHPLIGLYSLFSVLVMLCFVTELRPSIYELAKNIVAFALGASFAVMPIVRALPHLFDSTSSQTALTKSYIYVFLRTPHHLDPWSWTSTWWYYALLCLTVSGACLVFLKFIPNPSHPDVGIKLRALRFYLLGAAIPFLFGLVIRPYDQNGTLLQFYLFRFLDVLLPLFTLLFSAVVLERILLLNLHPFVQYLAPVVAFSLIAYPTPKFIKDTQSLQSFPLSSKKVSADWLELCNWVRKNTEQNALFITSPRGSETFPWLARRKIVGTFKQVPLSGGLQEWYRKMTLLGDLEEPWQKRGFPMARHLLDRYHSHKEPYVRKLLTLLHAQYFVTESRHVLNLPIVFQNSHYTIYKDSKG